jgi:hypothetical protein
MVKQLFGNKSENQRRFEDGIKNGRINEGGWLKDPKIFIEFWHANPNAPVELIVRSFNNTKGSFSGSIRLRLDDINIKYGAKCISFERPQFEVFRELDNKLYDLLLTKIEENAISCKNFVDLGGKIASILGRKLTITHQRGGKIHMAEFTRYDFSP